MTSSFAEFHSHEQCITHSARSKDSYHQLPRAKLHFLRRDQFNFQFSRCEKEFSLVPHSGTVQIYHIHICTYVLICARCSHSLRYFVHLSARDRNCVNCARTYVSIDIRTTDDDDPLAIYLRREKYTLLLRHIII